MAGTPLTAVTDLGDSAVLIPLILLAATYLAWSGWRRAAAVLMGAGLVVGLAVALAKVVLIGCGAAASVWHIRSPSGHTALSVVVFGLLGLILGSRLKSMAAGSLLLGAVALAAAIGASRVWLGFHSWQEVAAGAVIGAAVLSAGAVILDRAKAPPIRPGRLTILCLLAVLGLSGLHLPAEEAINRIAAFLKSSAVVCIAG